MKAAAIELRRHWVDQAARAPSAHNIQPARWRFVDDGVELHEDTTRWLAAADPTGRDNRIALGMAWEAMRLALADDGLAIGEPAFDPAPYPAANGLRRVARATLGDGATADPLTAYLSQRRSWRGRFAAADGAALSRLDACIDAHGDTALALPDRLRAGVADAYDRAAAALLDDAASARELYHWLRFRRGDPRWSRDGLSADCLALSQLEALGAAWLMRPRVLGWLSRLGLSKQVVSERGKTLSASRLIVIHASDARTPFEVGRHWLRFWLALTASGFSAVPMSAMTDVPTARTWLLRTIALPPQRIVINLMRVGPTPVPPPARSARLPVDELLLDP